MTFRRAGWHGPFRWFPHEVIFKIHMWKQSSHLSKMSSRHVALFYFYMLHFFGVVSELNSATFPLAALISCHFELSVWTLTHKWGCLYSTSLCIQCIWRIVARLLSSLCVCVGWLKSGEKIRGDLSGLKTCHHTNKQAVFTSHLCFSASPSPISFYRSCVSDSSVSIFFSDWPYRFYSLWL